MACFDFGREWRGPRGTILAEEIQIGKKRGLVAGLTGMVGKMDEKLDVYSLLSCLFKVVNKWLK